MTTPEERVEKLAHLLEMNRVMRTLRVQIEAAAHMAKSVDELPLAFAAFHLSDSLGVYIGEVTSFMERQLEDDD